MTLLQMLTLVAMEYRRISDVAAYNELGIRKAATIHDGSPYAEQLQQVFANRFVELGGEITAQEAVNVGSQPGGLAVGQRPRRRRDGADLLADVHDQFLFQRVGKVEPQRANRGLPQDRDADPLYAI